MEGTPLREYLCSEGEDTDTLVIEADTVGLSSASNLTKREYFAGLAMQGILSKAGFSAAHNDLHQYLAQESVKFADALLTELANE